jgi:hypothetical protein
MELTIENDGNPNLIIHTRLDQLHLFGGFVVKCGHEWEVFYFK